MKKSFANHFSNLFRRSADRAVVKMSEDDNISYSRRRLWSSINGRKGAEFDAAIAKYLREIRYPPVADFKKGLEWFNVSEPISFEKHLKGKLVLLDFFTYCCINCMHILPDLKEIEEEIPIESGLVVIGVHSAKFENEKISSNILSAVQRYNIAHPVVNDSSMDMWRKCEVHCWPTLLLLGPYANPIVMLTGEGHKDELRSYIKSAIKYYKHEGLISDHKLPMKAANWLLPDDKGPLLFPGKIAIFKDLLAISDSGNNRVLVLKNGELTHKIGNGKLGMVDGNFEEATFNNPQGIAFLSPNLFYVCDTDNHAIRLVDLTKQSVVRVAGTGVQGNDYKGGKIGVDQPISSPWDLVSYQTESGENVLIIAMAGTHQIWALFLDDTKWWKNVEYKAGVCAAIAGSGREENRNNSYPHTAGFAQPSGLALSRKNRAVYIADSESSSVRKLSLVDGKVTHVVGGDRNPNNLFAFGDEDGALYNAKLQHALGLAISENEHTLFVADTYNHKIKKVALSRNHVTTLSVAVNNNKLAKFKEPAGLCMSPENPKLLYIADTNNHCVKIAELDKEDNIAKITILGVKLKDDEVDKIELSGEKLRMEPLKIECETKVTIGFKINLIGGLKLTPDAPQKWHVLVPNSKYSVAPIRGNFKYEEELEIVVNAPKKIGGNDKMFVKFDLTTCTDLACLPKNFVVEIPFLSVSQGGATESIVYVNLSPDKYEIF